MFEIQLIPALLIFFCGTIAGISLTLLFNKMRTGSASASKIKQEMEDYQGQVEAHFEETSKKVSLEDLEDAFKEMWTDFDPYIWLQGPNVETVLSDDVKVAYNNAVTLPITAPAVRDTLEFAYNDFGTLAKLSWEPFNIFQKYLL